MTLVFTDANNATFTYSFTEVGPQPITETKNITREIFGPLPKCSTASGDLAAATNYQDLWWAAPAGSESGWGVFLTHQGDTIFATWFTYDINNTAMWLVVTAPKTAPGVYTGTLYRTFGPEGPPNPYNPADVNVTAVGRATFTFRDGNSGVFNYTVNGTAQAKTITREVFQSPGTVCQ
jgi:hypothetical protein